MQIGGMKTPGSGLASADPPCSSQCRFSSSPKLDTRTGVSFRSQITKSRAASDTEVL